MQSPPEWPLAPAETSRKFNVGNEAVLTQGFHYPFTSPANPIAPGGVYLMTTRPPPTYGAQLRISF